MVLLKSLTVRRHIIWKRDKYISYQTAFVLTAKLVSFCDSLIQVFTYEYTVAQQSPKQAMSNDA
jgi:hypothetical protein